MGFRPIRFLKRALGVLAAAQDSQLGELVNIKDKIDNKVDELGDRIQKELGEEVDKLRDRLLGGHEREEMFELMREIKAKVDELEETVAAFDCGSGVEVFRAGND